MKKLIKQIQSDDIESVYREITNTATIWAIAGFIDHANRLLEKLWSLKLEHNRNTWLNDEGFQIVWHLTNKKPNNIPFELKNINDIQTENWQRHFMPYWYGNINFSSRVKGKEWTELSDNDLCLVGIGLAYDEKALNKVADQKHQLDSFNAITKFITACNPVGHSLMNSLECALFLAARNNLIKETEKLLIQWGNAYKLYGSNTFPSYLMRDLATAKILLTGVLTPVFELSAEKCENDLQTISISLDERVTKGQSLVYEKLKWKELLKYISTKAIQKADFTYDKKSIAKSWLGFPPVKKDEIVKAEARLNIKLPKEYKEFLLTTNGFNPFSLTPTLLPIDKIDWLKNLDPQLVEIWSNAMQDVSGDFGKAFNNSLLIGGHQEEQQLLLIPSAKSKNWECWFFASWTPGETKYPNFRYYMEKELQEFEENERN